ncbi:MAG: hypothetical protein ACOWWH_07220 [Eubacteriaceae bacterium]
MKANIHLKSGKEIIVDDLQTIYSKTYSGTTSIKIEDFTDFFLNSKEKLIFVGKPSIVTLISDEIAYVELKEK